MAKKMVRIEFDDITKNIIARRAGFKCSFPGCNKTLVGPGVNNNESICIGECAHIFSAVLNGPRTNGGLNEFELKKPENGIFLCSNHHKIIDRKSKDNKYTSDLLTRYKNRHEFLISAELGEYTYPLNWINNLKIQGTVFHNPLEINLGKVTLFTGENSTGKSTIVEVLYSSFSQKIMPRWNKPDSEFSTQINLDNPVLSVFTATIRNNQLFYQIKNTNQPFVPYDFFVLYLRETMKSHIDDLKIISDCFGLDRSFVKSMLSTTGIRHGIFTKSIEIEKIRTQPYPVDTLNVDIGTRGLRSFRSYSGTERSRVILDIAISFATEISKFKSVLLLIDWPEIYSFDDCNIKPYLDYLQSSKAHFQSILVSPNPRINLDWSGWVIAKFNITEEHEIEVIQTEK